MENLGCHAKELGLDLERNGKSDRLEPSCLLPRSFPGLAQWRASAATVTHLLTQQLPVPSWA